MFIAQLPFVGGCPIERRDTSAYSVIDHPTGFVPGRLPFNTGRGGGDRAGEQPDEPAGRSIEDTTPLPNTNKPLSLKSWNSRSPTEEDCDTIALEAGCRDVGFPILVDVSHRHVVGAEPDRER